MLTINVDNTPSNLISFDGLLAYDVKKTVVGKTLVIQVYQNPSLPKCRAALSKVLKSLPKYSLFNHKTKAFVNCDDVIDECGFSIRNSYF